MRAWHTAGIKDMGVSLTWDLSGLRHPLPIMAGGVPFLVMPPPLTPWVLTAPASMTGVSKATPLEVEPPSIPQGSGTPPKALPLPYFCLPTAGDCPPPSEWSWGRAHAGLSKARHAEFRCQLGLSLRGRTIATRLLNRSAPRFPHLTRGLLTGPPPWGRCVWPSTQQVPGISRSRY